MKQPKAVKRNINPAREGTIRLWGLQPIDVWECLRLKDVISVTEFTSVGRYKDSMALGGESKLRQPGVENTRQEKTSVFQRHTPETLRVPAQPLLP